MNLTQSSQKPHKYTMKLKNVSVPALCKAQYPLSPSCFVTSNAARPGQGQIAQQKVVVLSKQHILRLDASIDQIYIVSILQNLDHLLDVGGNDVRWQTCSLGVTRSQGTARSIVHDQIG